MEYNIGASLQYRGEAQIIQRKNNLNYNYIYRHNSGQFSLSKLFVNRLNNISYSKIMYADMISNQSGQSVLKNLIAIQSITPDFEDEYDVYSAKVQFTISANDTLSTEYSDKVDFVLYDQNKNALCSIQSGYALKDLIQSGTSILVNWHLFIDGCYINNELANIDIKELSKLFMMTLTNLYKYDMRPYSLDIISNKKSALKSKALLTGFYTAEDSIGLEFLNFNCIIQKRDILSGASKAGKITIIINYFDSMTSQLTELLSLPLNQSLNDLIIRNDADMIINFQFGLKV